MPITIRTPQPRFRRSERRRNTEAMRADDPQRRELIRMTYEHSRMSIEDPQCIAMVSQLK
jgi:hypothetical protein